MAKYAVYGTLRKGESNHDILNHQDVAFIETRVVEGFDMYAVSSWYPGIIPGKGSIEVEIYEVADKNVERMLDNLEGYYENNLDDSLYLKKTLDDGTFIYIYNDVLYGAPQIKSGNWLNLKNEVNV